MAVVDFYNNQDWSQATPDQQQWLDPYNQMSRQPTVVPAGSGPVSTAPALPWGTTRDAAYTQFKDLYAGLGVPALRPDEENIFDSYWKNAKESGSYQGPGYDRTWAQLFPDIQANAYARRQDRDGGSNAPAASAPAQAVPFQFDDPYTKMLEGIAQKQLGEVRSNPDLDNMLGFLRQRFTDLSTNPGFSPADLALLQTQAFEPIEQNRQASQRRSLERTAARGMLPSSGLAELDSREVDQAYDKLRAAASRDVGVNAIAQRRGDLDKAGQVAQALGIQIPQGQRSEELALASLLYDLPNKSLQNALAVLNGSPTSNDLYTQALQGSQDQRLRQAMQDAQNQQLWGSLGSLFGGLF